MALNIEVLSCFRNKYLEFSTSIGSFKVTVTEYSAAGLVLG